MKRLATTLLALFALGLVTASAHATVYYVSPTGNDLAVGLDSTSAWLSIDNGELTAVLAAGDTVYVLPGTYLPSNTILLDLDGTEAAPIIYRKYGDGDVVFDMANQDTDILRLTGANTWIDGLEFTNTRKPAIDIEGDSCRMLNCYVHDIDDIGVTVTGAYTVLRHNIIADVTGNGLEVDAESCNTYGNTVVNSGGVGIHYKGGVSSGRIFNNLSTGHSEGIRGTSDVTAGFNLTWNNSSDYTNGITDSAGGLTVDPRLVNITNGNYNARHDSPVIDAGLDQGYPYLDGAPDIGGVEYVPHVPVSYYVGPSGDDAADGLDSANAWAAVDNGDANGWLFPGDTVNVLAGTYSIATSVWLTTAGSDSLAIVYRRLGDNPAVLDMGGAGDEVVQIDGNHTQFSGLTLTDCARHGIWLFGDSCQISDCVVNAVSLQGIDVNSSGNVLLRNVIYNASQSGIGIEPGAENNHVYNNTVYGVGLSGVWIDPTVVTTRVFNNALVQCQDGIEGAAGNICAFNNIWDFSNTDYAGAAGDSAGGSSVNPMFVNAGSGDFDLQNGSPMIDAGLDVGYDFRYSAPDKGGIEWRSVLPALAPIGARNTAENVNLTFGVSAIDDEADPVLTTSTLPSGANFTDHGDGSGDFNWTPSFVQAGAYDITFYATDAWSEADSEVVTITVTAADNQPPVLATIGARSTTENVTLTFAVSATDTESTPVLTTSVLPSGAGFTDNGDGTGDFDWTPAYPQAGSYDITFYATDDSLAVDSELVTITVDPAVTAYIVVTPDDTTVSINSTIQFTVTGYDAGDDQAAPGNITWGLTAALGSIDAAGLFDATTVGTGAVYAISDLGPVDTTASLQVTPGALNYVRIEYLDGTVVGDTTMTTDNDTTRFYCRGYDSGDNLTVDEVVTWTRIDPAGIASHAPSGGIFTTLELNATGTLRLVARHASGIADTTGVITCVGGALASLVITPDEATVSADSSLLFAFESLDIDGNPSEPAVVGTWSVIGGIGTITESGGLFTPTTTGEGNIVVTGAGLTDTSGTITVTPGALDSIVVAPDTVRVGLNDTVQFVATGYDADANQTTVGDLTWKLIGRTGTIDSTGLFVATRTGVAAVAATAAAGPTDTTGMLAVEELLFTSIPIGTGEVRPGAESSPLLAYRLDNYYDEAKTVTGFTFQTAFGGPGNSAQKLENADSLQLYLDTDNDSLLSAGDSLLSQTALEATSLTAVIDPILFVPGTGFTFLATVLAGGNSRDGDTLDLFVRPGVDIVTDDGTIVAGPDSANSLGQVVIDGMVADQVHLYPTGTVTVLAEDSLYAVMSLDIPRNGYGTDTLVALSLINLGTAVATDLDSLCLLIDDGDREWHGPQQETPVGRLYYTGSRWTASGLTVVLDGVDNMFYVAADIAEFPAPGRTISLGLPINAVEVASGNDGPIDFEVAPVETITIQSEQRLTVGITAQPSRDLVPGEWNGPLTTLHLINSYATALSLDSVRISLELEDPDGATPTELDSQIDSVLLYLERDGNTSGLTAGDSLLAVGQVTGGGALLTTGGFALDGMGADTYLSIAVALSADNAKDGNTINMGLTSADDLYFAASVQIDGGFPTHNLSEHVIDAFAAASVVTADTGSDDLNAGATGVLVFDFILPGNGYATDNFNRLSLTNIGSLNEKEAIANLKLYSDQTGDGFSPDDGLIGKFTYNDDGWNLSDLAVAMPPEGRRFLVTADISGGQFEAGTFQLQLPIGGCRYSSRLTGPDDLAVTAPGVSRVYPADRITVISVPKSTSLVVPGEDDLLLLSFALYNGYGGEAQALQGLTFVNRTRTRSTAAFADHELGQVWLHHDADNDRILGNDPLVAGGYFVNGELQLSGLGIALPADSLSYFFVTADVPLDLIDADSLDLYLPGPADLVFSRPVVINGDLPLLSGGYRIVDGSVAAQYAQISRNPGTLSPGDLNITLFAFQPALNGNLADTLTAVQIRNLGDADSSDVDALELWLDGDGDQAFGPGDALQGAFNYSAVSGWTCSGLALEIHSSKPTLFVVADIALTATPDRTFRWQLPTNGCTYASANDGPIDGPLVSTNTFSISASPLGVAYQSLNENYTVGQTIEARYSVTNRQGTALTNVTGRLVGYADSATVVIDSSDAGPVTLDPGQTAPFVFYATAAAVGPISFDLQAMADADSSTVLHTNTATVQQHPDNVVLKFTNSIPTAVTRGQTNIFPFSVGFDHPDETGSVAAIRLDSMKISVADGQGAAMAANSAFSRIVLTAGYTNLTVVNTVPSQATVTLIFAEPVVVAAGEDVQFSLLVDIDSLAAAAAFALAIADASALPMVDDNSGTAVNVDAGVAFPLSTPSCRIDEPSQLMALSYTSLVGPTVNYGQTDVAMVQLDLRHPGGTGTSQIQITDLSLELVDDVGVPVTASDLVDRIRLIKHTTVIGELTGAALDTAKPAVQLSSPVTLNPGEIDSIRVAVTIRETAELTAFSLRIPDSLSFVVRDLSSGSSLATTTDTLVLATGSAFPVESNQTQIRYAAMPLALCPVSLLPTATVGGVDSLGLIELSLQYPVPADYSSLWMDQILVTVTDTLGAPLDPAHLFDRLGYIDPSGTPSYQQFVLTESGSARFTLGSQGLRIDPGDSLTLTLIGDISVGSAVDHFVLVIGSESNISLVDFSDTTAHPGLATAVGCSAAIPFATSHVSVYQPAGRPDLTGETGAVRIAHRGQQDVTIFEAELVYDNPISQGELNINGLHGRLWRRTESGFVPANEGAVFDSIALYVDDLPLAGDTNPSDDSLALAFDGGLTVQQGDRLKVTLRSHIRADAGLGNYVVRFEDSTFLEMADANLATTIYPVLAGTDYPIQSLELSIQAEGLTASFTNYPNPFHPDEGPTVIAYVLPEAAHVDIEIFTITGDLVKEVVIDGLRPAGSNQSDTWSGANGAGLDVVPGTYYCRITARYESGTEETMRRKVAVIR